MVIGRQASATSGGNVGAIKGLVNVYGYGPTDLIVDDSGDTNGRAATLKGKSGEGPMIKLTANRGWISVRKEGTEPSEVLPDAPRAPKAPKAPKVLKDLRDSEVKM